MARPVTNTPRLSTIDPAQLALDVARGAQDHLVHLLFAFASPDAPPPDLWQLRHTVSTLAAYAVHGAALDAPVQEYLLSLLPLWTYAMGASSSVDTPEFDRALAGDLDDLDDDWRGRLVLVMVAAIGRETLAKARSTVSVAQLAALASMSPDSVRLLGRKGEIVIDEGDVSGKEARRWLGARGVAL